MVWKSPCNLKYYVSTKWNVCILIPFKNIFILSTVTNWYTSVLLKYVSILLYLQHITVLASHIIFFFYKRCLCSVQSEGQIGWNIPWGVLQNQIGIANKYSYTRNNFFPQLGIFCVKGFHSLLFYKRIVFFSFLKKKFIPSTTFINENAWLWKEWICPGHVQKHVVHSIF